MLRYIRKNILALQPYSTARDEFKGGDISVWLDANESPYGNGVNRYPDPHQKRLKSRISEIFHLPAESVFVGGAGSDEAIDLTFRIFCEPGVENVVAITPSYGVYKVAAEINNVALREVLLNEDFSLPVERILDAADHLTKIIWICSPNNPTGNAFPKEDILAIAERFNGIVVVDEAYADFSDIPSLIPEIGAHPNIVVLRTFSKAWGMAGLRAGMAFADPEIITFYNRVKYPYNMSSLVQEELLRRIGLPGQCGADGILPQEAEKLSNVDEIRLQRDRLASLLSEIPCVKHVYPSDANFLLVKVDDPDLLYDRLVKAGIIVRNRSRMPLCEGCLRITVGTPDENRRLLEAIAGTPSSAIPSGREASIERATSETDIHVSVNLEGNSPSQIDTGLKFFDHMLWQIPHHAGISLTVKCKGDLEVDEHHTMEDVAIALGDALRTALGDKRGIDRYGFVLPMDESRAMVLIDLGGRIDFQWSVPFTREYVGDTPTEMFRHFFESLCHALRCNLHIEAAGLNNHHLIEGVFKAFARALRMAVRRDPFSFDLPSSKGVL